MNLATLRLAAMAALLALPLCAFAASADDDRREVRQVITAQFQAFADDDADAAFATATPSVRSEMGHPGRFLAMVRGTYPMVYHPAAVNFLDLEFERGSAWQMVRVTDDAGKSWLALFRLDRQPDGQWRIAGCDVQETRWQPA